MTMVYSSVWPSGGCARHLLRADEGAGAGLVVDDHRVAAELVLQLLADVAQR
jgi:hypothetical protein